MQINNAICKSMALFFTISVLAGDHEQILKNFQEQASKSQRLSSSLKSAQAVKNIQLATGSIKKINEWADLVQGYQKQLEEPCKQSSHVIKIARVIRGRALLEGQTDGDAWHVLHQKAFQVDRSLRNCFWCFACNKNQVIQDQQKLLHDACQNAVVDFNARSQALLAISESDMHTIQQQFSDQLPVAEVVIESSTNALRQFSNNS
ncbi:MAG: hypothetical protein ACXWL2_04715 [Candidatus Chromulinivorax sp.]